jgi:hypothetical protein
LRTVAAPEAAGVGREQTGCEEQPPQCVISAFHSPHSDVRDERVIIKMQETIQRANSLQLLRFFSC